MENAQKQNIKDVHEAQSKIKNVKIFKFILFFAKNILLYF